MDNELTNDSAFLLHQASERYITAYTLVKTGYKPKTHNLKVLYTKLQEIEPAFALRFDLANSKEKYHFVLLQKAYIEARYSKAFAITTDELSFIQNKVKLLAKMVKKFCELEIGA